MASSSSVEGVPITKGGEILVKVEDLAGGLISVKLVNGDKTFRGILLQEYAGKSNEYGTNPERIISAPVWPPLSGNSSGINLKTIPCSTERYSYKLEGQPSNLNVFQPDPTKRSHRNQPAPQLSRILRPRRFVCRKCKKAFHLEEQGTELSSTALNDQSDRRTSDSSAMNSDSEVNQYPLKSDNGEQSTSASFNGNSQSIRHVTPSIIPKLNEEFDVNLNDPSKTHIISSTETLPKSKKNLQSEQSSKISELSETKSTVLKKRKVDAVSEKQKLKKIKLGPQKPPEPVNSGSTVTSTITLDAPSEPILPVSTEEVKDVPTSSNSVPKPVVTDSPISQEQIRKNRIKAQYVSVASPFRFPFGKKSKISPAQTSGNLNAAGDTKVKSETNSTRKHSEKPEGNSVTSPKSSISSVRQNSRYRTRTQSNSASAVPDPSDLSSSVNDVEESPKTNEVSPQHTDSSQKDNNLCSLSPRLSGSLSVSSKEKHSTSVQPTPKASISGNSSVSNNTGTPTNEGNSSTQGRRKAFDYEKPKNRWMREARARRNQEERSSNSISSVTNHGTSSSTSTDTENSATTNIQSSSVSRLRIRSGDASNSNPNENASKSVGNMSSKVKLPNGSSNSRHTETGNSSLTDKCLDDSDVISAVSSHVSPCLTQSTDSTSLTLPVLKIKINRNRQPSGSSKNAPTHYEVVKTPIADAHSETASQISNEESHSHTHVDTFSSPVQKSDISCNGIRSPSPVHSSGSSKKGYTGENTIATGPLVKRCKLADDVVFRVGDLVWSKLSGWPYWPAQITSIQRIGSEVEPSSLEKEPVTKDSHEKISEQVCFVACLHWFAWHQVSYMPCDKLYHFLEHCKRFDNKKKRGVFRQAVNEAKQAAEKRQEIHSTDSESEWENEMECNTPHQEPVAEQPTEICVPDNSQQSIQVSQLESSVQSIPDMKHGEEAVITAELSAPLPPKVKKGKSKESKKRKSSLSSNTINSPTKVLCDESTTDECSHQHVASSSSKAPKSRSLCKRESKRKAQSILANNKISEDENSSPKEYGSSFTSSESNVRLKIILSKPKLKTTEINQEASNPIEIQNSCPPDSSDPVTPTVQSQIAEDPLRQTSESQLSEDNQKSFLTTADSQDFDRTFGATHSELLTQFPHVFPDLKVSGILSDTVDIPTFSEDESEEEDAGRLIIDPDVMASVNVPLSTNNHYMTETLKPEPDILREDLYSLSSNNLPYNRALPSHTFGNIHSYSQTPLATISDHSIKSFPAPAYPSDSFSHHSYDSSSYRTECLISKPVPAYPFPNQSTASLSRLPPPPHLTPSNVPIPNRTAYFQSSHLGGVPSTTTTAHSVPYITTEYSSL
uniref:PWWP domain-containing protein n=1 Tax=Trichobilharzia regenti TaxID=157069 RepID=A0AA85KRG1_TRIRE|nr:unnamed protein product [Trichobilharzia regenti]